MRPPKKTPPPIHPCPDRVQAENNNTRNAQAAAQRCEESSTSAALRPGSCVAASLTMHVNTSQVSHRHQSWISCQADMLLVQYWKYAQMCELRELRASQTPIAHQEEHTGKASETRKADAALVQRGVSYHSTGRRIRGRSHVPALSFDAMPRTGPVYRVLSV